MSATDAGGDALSRLTPVAFAGILVMLWAALLYAPTERIEGDIQRVMYLHVPAALSMYAAYGLLFLSSVLYLVGRRERWDEVGAAAAEVSLLFATIVLTTGSVWGRPVWGTWWIWDGRLTSTLVLWLILAAYQMLRRYGGEGDQVARYSAVLAIVGFVDLPIIHYSVTWWRTLHPQPKIMTEGSLGGGLETSMLLTWAISLVAMLGMVALLIALRLRIERQSRRVARALDSLHESVPAA